MDPHYLDADPHSTYHPDADPDSDVYLIWIRIRIRLFTLMRSDSYPDPSFQIKAQSLNQDPVLDPAYFHFDAGPGGDPDPDFI